MVIDLQKLRETAERVREAQAETKRAIEEAEKERIRQAEEKAFQLVVSRVPAILENGAEKGETTILIYSTRSQNLAYRIAQWCREQRITVTVKEAHSWHDPDSGWLGGGYDIYAQI